MLFWINSMGKTIIGKSEIPAACDERFAPLVSAPFVSWRKMGIKRSGISYLVPGYNMERVGTDDVMLILTADGLGYAFSENEEWDLRPGTLFMSGPLLPVGFGCAGDHWNIYWWYIDTDAATSIRYYYEECAQQGILSASMEALFSEVGDVPRNREWSMDVDIKNPNRALMLSELIAGYVSEFIDAPIEKSLNAQEQRLLVLWREVDRNLHQDWSINDFAAFLEISPASVQRWMQKYYGKSCHQILIDRRMLRAKQLLQHTEYNLENIANQLGYCDPFTFSNAFKKYYGQAPSLLRKE